MILDNNTTVCFVLYVGGTLLTVRGFGFSEDTIVTIDSSDCKVVHASDTELTCRTPAVSELTGNDLLSVIIVKSWPSCLLNVLDGTRHDLYFYLRCAVAISKVFFCFFFLAFN